MGKNGKKTRSKKGTPKSTPKPALSFKEENSLILESCSNVVTESCPGCFCWNGISDSDWMIGKPEKFRKSDFGLRKSDNAPDLSLDPSNKILTAINSSPTPRCYHITVEHPVIGKFGALVVGTARTEDNREITCVAFVLLLPPETMVEVCQVQVDTDDVRISSDIVDWTPHPSPSNGGVCFPWFPLGGKGPYLCSQGCGGGLTHFSHPSTFHALDFQAPVGTPVLAVADGVVTDIRQKCCVSGIHVSNLFQWNSVAIEVDDISNEGCAEDTGSKVIVEYVHIKANSVRVAVGDKVKAGQFLCFSGDAGFCPVAHLHIEAHRSSELGAPSVPMSWEMKDGGFLSPEAGKYYSGDMCMCPKVEGTAEGDSLKEPLEVAGADLS